MCGAGVGAKMGAQMGHDLGDYLSGLLESLRPHFWWIVAGIGGRMMFHSREAQAGRRRFFGRELPFELFMAIGMGLIGYSCCAWFKLDGAVSAGAVSAVAYLGPRAIDVMFDRAQGALEGFFGRKGGAG